MLRAANPIWEPSAKLRRLPIVSPETPGKYSALQSSNTLNSRVYECVSIVCLFTIA